MDNKVGNQVGSVLKVRISNNPKQVSRITNGGGESKKYVCGD